MSTPSWPDFRARCDALLDDLSLDPSQPLTTDALRAAIEMRHGRKVTLSPLPTHTGATAGLCGLWISLGRTDHIFYETSTNAFHQRHIILHELSHLLLDHTTRLDKGEWPGVEALFPGLDPDMVLRLLARGRTNYTELQERQAELMATLIHRRSTERTSPAGPQTAGETRSLDRLARALGLPDLR